MIKEKLVEESLATRHRKIYGCADCLQEVKQQLLNPNKRLKQADVAGTSVSTPTHILKEEGLQDENVTQVLHALESGNISQQQIKELLEAIGKRIHQSFAEAKPTAIFKA
ncbi:unnamed protein product [Orchesella dallaii]|uniref:Uncharacterized protein n=1 Tax=Orchesella dallaii TaxID=48710 RepID=A0ABP1RPN5_9HEXA